jgi:hypothetical protein
MVVWRSNIVADCCAETMTPLPAAGRCILDVIKMQLLLVLMEYGNASPKNAVRC